MDEIRKELRLRAATKQVQGEEALEEGGTMRKLMSDKNIFRKADKFHFSPIPLCPRAYKELPYEEIQKIQFTNANPGISMP